MLVSGVRVSVSTTVGILVGLEFSCSGGLAVGISVKEALVYSNVEFVEELTELPIGAVVGILEGPLIAKSVGVSNHIGIFVGRCVMEGLITVRRSERCKLGIGDVSPSGDEARILGL